MDIVFTVVTLLFQKRGVERGEGDNSEGKCIPASSRIHEKRVESLTSLLAWLTDSPLRENTGDLPPRVNQHCVRC